jgi:AraC-like DNA-binding protein
VAKTGRFVRSVPWGEGPLPRWLVRPPPAWPELLDGLDLRVYSANFRRLEPDWQGVRPIDGTTTLYLVVDGAGDAEVDGEPLALRPDRLILVPGHARMSHRTDAGVTLFWFRLTATVFDGVDLFALHRRTLSVTPADPALCRQLGHHLVALWDPPGPTAAIAAAAIVTWLMTPLFDLMLQDADRARALGRFLPVLRYVDSHLAEPLPVADLARIAGLERSHFTRVFTRELGQSPAAWIRAQRLQRLSRALLTTDTPLAQLAHDFGFADLRIVDQRLVVDRKQIGAGSGQGGKQQCGDAAAARPENSAFHELFLIPCCLQSAVPARPEGSFRIRNGLAKQRESAGRSPSRTGCALPAPRYWYSV